MNSEDLAELAELEAATQAWDRWVRAEKALREAKG